MGRNPDERVDRRWLWRGRRVCLFAGTTVSMPDTAENRAGYPLAYNQAPGTSSAIARVGAVLSVSYGAILDLGVCRSAGKGQGEVSLLRWLWDVLRPDDVLLGDRLMSGWVGMFLLKRRGVDTVSRLSAHRRADFCRGRRLGQGDHLVRWEKPTSIRSVGRRAPGWKPPRAGPGDRDAGRSVPVRAVRRRRHPVPRPPRGEAVPGRA